MQLIAFLSHITDFQSNVKLLMMRTVEKIFGKLFKSKEVDLVIKVLPYKRSLLIFQVVTTALQVAAFFYSTIGKFNIYNQLQKFNSDVVKLVNCLSDFILLINNVVAIFSTSHYKIIVDLTKFVWVQKMPNTTRFSFQLLIWGLRLAVFVPIAINIYFLWFSIGWNMYKYYLNRDVSYWFHNLTTYTFLTTAMMTKHIFYCINEQLRKCRENYITSNSITQISTLHDCENSAKPQSDYTSLKMITEVQNKVCDFLECMNQNSKPLLTMLMFSIIGNIFYDCTILIEFGMKPKIIKGIDIKPYIYTMHFFFVAISSVS